MTYTASNSRQLKAILDKIIPSSKEMLYALNRTMYNQMVNVEHDIINDHYWTDRTGELTKSHTVIQHGDLTVRLVNTSEHAKFLRYGTKTHSVKAKDGSMRFMVGGQTIHSKGHVVKGISKRDWMREAYNARLDKIKKAVIETAKKEFK